jgi:hypothetical protein
MDVILQRINFARLHHYHDFQTGLICSSIKNDLPWKIYADTTLIFLMCLKFFEGEKKLEWA